MGYKIWKVALFLMASCSIFAQNIPKSFNYQVSVRDMSGNPISNKIMGFEIALSNTQNSNTYLYKETHQKSTNEYGVVNFQIGTGSVAPGYSSFHTLSFIRSEIFIKISVDTQNIRRYDKISESQLVSVPYALASDTTNFAFKSAQLNQNKANTGEVLKWNGSMWAPAKDSVGLSTGGNYSPGKGISIVNNIITNTGDGDSSSTNEFQELSIRGNILYLSNSSNPVTLPTGAGGGGFTHYIGEFFGGGIIFYIYKDKSDQEHGLIASLSNFSHIWSGNLGLAGASSTWDGFTNTATIRNQSNNPSFAANAALNYVPSGFANWYLPSIDELVLLSVNRYVLNKTLDVKNNPTYNEISLNPYWSSTEFGTSNARAFDFGQNGIFNTAKTTMYSCRFIRQF